MADPISNINEDAAAPKPPARPRDRIVVQARDLFRKHGIRGIGVDAIADAAGTNKMTLYRHFGSKDELVVECLRKVAEDIEAMWQTLEAAHPGNPWAALDAWVRHGAERMLCDRRGCDLANAAVELGETDHPARRVIADLKTTYRDRLADLCRRAGARDADLLADTLTLLLEGARVSRQSVGPDGPSARFVRIGQAIIATFRDPASSR